MTEYVDYNLQNCVKRYAAAEAANSFSRGILL
jgi:hypothetical protein